MPASPLERILAHYRVTYQTQKEKGSYFEELIRTYFRYEASYADLYSDVWLFADWAKEIGTFEFGISAKDTRHGGISRHPVQMLRRAPPHHAAVHRQAASPPLTVGSHWAGFGSKVLIGRA